MKMCLKLAYSTLSYRLLQTMLRDEYLLWFSLSFCWRLNFLMIFPFQETWLQISLCLWLDVCVCVCVCVHPLNKDVSQAITGTFCQCHFQKIVVWVTFKFSLLLMLRFKSFKMWLPMSLNFIWLRIILALRVKGHSRGMCSFQITTSLKYITLFL